MIDTRVQLVPSVLSILAVNGLRPLPPWSQGCSYLSIPPIPLLLRATKHQTAITETGAKSGCCCSFSAKRVQMRAEVEV